MVYSWNFDVILQYQGAFARGVVMTLELSLLSIFFATVLGTLLGVARVFLPSPTGKRLVGSLIEVLRSIPIIVVMVWIFYVMPLLTGVRLPPFETAVAALSLVSAAFVAEIVRAGIEAVPKGQLEAAEVLGLSKIQTIWQIVLPQAFLRNLPAIIGEYSTITKDTTLAVIIGVNELLHATTSAAVLSYRPVELYSFLGVLFLVIILPLSLLSKKLEFNKLTSKSKAPR